MWSCRVSRYLWSAPRASDIVAIANFGPAQSLDYEGECSAADLEIIMVLFSMYLKA